MKHFKLLRGELAGGDLGSVPTLSRLDSLSLVSRQSDLAIHLGRMAAILVLVFTLGIGSVWAADPVEIASGTFDGKNGTYTTGWSTTGTGKGRNDCIIIGSGENITSPSVDLSQYESITISIKARRYGTLTNSKATIQASFAGVSLGTTEASGTSATTSLTAIEYDVVTATAKTGTFVFTCTNATSAGSTHGAGINSIVITGVKKAAAPKPGVC